MNAPAPRRIAAYVGAGALHLALLAAILSLPPALLLDVDRIAQTLDVRFYTVSAPDSAETDAPLIEPPLAEPDPVDTPAALEAPAPVVLEDSDPDELGEAEAEAAPDEATEEPPTVLEPTAEVGTRLAPSETPRSSPPPPSAPAQTQAGAPLSTTQIRPPPPREALRPPSFANILARAETQLDPDDFQVAQLAGNPRAAVRDTFCLSSSDANLEAGECPDGPNARSAELARYGLSDLGEEAPEFLEDMSRLEFRLRMLGADASAVERILIALDESRRQWLDQPLIEREMSRTQGEQVDNLGVGGPITPARARDPSGEP